MPSTRQAGTVPIATKCGSPFKPFKPSGNGRGCVLGIGGEHGLDVVKPKIVSGQSGARHGVDVVGCQRTKRAHRSFWREATGEQREIVLLYAVLVILSDPDVPW